MPEKIEHVLDTTVNRADQVKLQTADALEEAARRLRGTDLSGKSEEVKRILREVEERVNRLHYELGAEYQKISTEYSKRMAPVETLISDHPVPSVLIAGGVGFLLGALLFKRH